MMNLSEVVLLPQVRVENVVQVDGKDSEEAAGAGRVDGVAGVVLNIIGDNNRILLSTLTYRVRPCVGSVR